MVFLLSLVTGCMTPNKVQRIEAENSIVKYKQDTTDSPRFANLYPGKKTYPETCSENCYPASAVVACQAPAENCQFIGEQSIPTLHSDFSIRWGFRCRRVFRPEALVVYSLAAKAAPTRNGLRPHEH